MRTNETSLKISILSGSARKDNYTHRLALAIKHYYESEDVNIVDFREYDLPFFNGEPIDKHKPSTFQKKLHDSLSEANLVFVLSPEYNWFPSAEMVNFVHQFATSDNKELFNNKVFAFAGVSTGIGGKLPAIQLSQVFGKVIHYFNLDSVISSKMFEAMHIGNALDQNGRSLRSTNFDEFFKEFLEYNKNLTLRCI